MVPRRGDCVCHIGEAPGGDTGSAVFYGALRALFSLAQRLPLPNWSDTAHELTIWERRAALLPAGAGTGGAPDARNGPAPAALPALACAACGADASASLGCASAHSAGPAHKPEQGTASKSGRGLQAWPASERGDDAAEAHRRGVTGGAAAAPGVWPARCWWCRDAYCCAACARADAERHARRHALRLLFFSRRAIDDPANFEPLAWHVDMQHAQP